MTTNAPFPIQPELTAIALAFRNERLIADDVLPRKPVGVQEFKYLEHTQAENFTVPDTTVGRKGRPNEVEFTAIEKTSQTFDYGLDDVIPQSDMDNAPANYDPRAEAVEGLTELVMLDREIRAANMVFDINNYLATQRTTLAGTDQWSDFANSDPIVDILDAQDLMIQRANIAVMGRAVFTKLRQHPKIAKATHGNSGDTAVVARAAMAELLELDDVIVGEGWVNTEKPGQTPSYARVWGKHCALLYRNPTATPRRGVTFGITAQWGTKVAGSIPEPKVGLRGGVRVRSGESVRELILAAGCGYFFADAVG